MATEKKMIDIVKNNKEKQDTYRVMIGKFNKAINNDFYFEALLIVYAMLEDRMKSFLYYIGAIRRVEDTKLNVNKTKKTLRRLYYGTDEAAEGKHLDIKKISAKGKLIRSTLMWAMDYEGIPEEKYLAVLKSEYEGCIDMDGLLTTLDGINEWREYRNEIIHGLLNKNVNSVNSDLRGKIETGMSYARFLDSQIKALKKKDTIRQTMRIKR